MELTAETLRKRAEQLMAQAHKYYEQHLVARGAAAELNNLANRMEKAGASKAEDDGA